MVADKVLINGHIIKMNTEYDYCEAIAVQGKKIICTGSNYECLNYSNSKTKVFDLKGKTVVPGFYDSHLHLISTFLKEISVNLENARSIPDILDLIEEARKNLKSNTFIYGSSLSEFRLKEKRLPTRRELDKVAPDVPVILSSIEFHTIVVNSFTMNLFRIPFTTNSFEKDEFNIFTGRIRNRGCFIARRKMYEMMSDDLHVLGMDSAIDKIIKKGVTTLVAVEGGSLFHDKHVDILMNNMKSIPVDVNIFYSTTDIKKVISKDLPRIGGDIFLDGSITSQNAALFKPYRDSKNNKGLLFFTFNELVEFIRQSHDLGLQVAVHAVGNRGIDFLLDAYQKVLSESDHKCHRHRIEHFELPTKEQITRVEELGLILAMHPTYEIYFRNKGETYDVRIGKERSLMTNPFREIFDCGIIVAGCSDSDVMRVDPLLGVYAAVNHPNPNSRITPFEALKMYTINGAYSVIEDNIKGSIKEGKIADLAVLDNNPLTVDSKCIKDIEVISTMKNGEFIYIKEGI
ncbi:amidohydrolase [Maledivibacter halophilus]|uniref:Amidohydrolase 3 domain-containing protein n=1 Tax=Maledivibacter halophilus TaxID=36842 RepID=A0A1T5ICK3_9FIRM|nr:amidohydrolase [Maledivibacter halophilus]SKC36867.1 hypothetical protein SAMN02194393_00212 [Maledivibacter halophilus]